ncbi:MULTISPECIES: manganese efflux pump MntP family protein [Halomonadaceae]|uniref:Putative manganese efflux pump MntP n=1 Tax=Modicisalibacter zincidurans TaxID=1178777 RepID=A0ABP9RAA7_9GAMM|nr:MULTISPECIES: manganese efflux pump MntP family protein [Halomonas]MCD6009889.1 manganese efflux pump MntP family protein [Halomonas sp. IOP_31]
MNFLSLVGLAFAMSTDAFAASIGRGVSLGRTHLVEALRIGIIFGTVEAITPVIGWGLGMAANRLVSNWDHWVAFALLSMLGLSMIYKGLKSDGGEPEDEKKDAGSKSVPFLALTAIATSIDAMAVGITLAFTDVNILVAAAIIGLATTLMVTIGIMLGRAIGSLVGKRAEIVGGLVLIGIGTWIAYVSVVG